LWAVFFYRPLERGENKVRIPRYDVPSHPRFTLGSQTVHMLKIVDFLRYVIDRDQLSISEYLEVMGQDPFFLVAATGLGKTVAVPLHVFVRTMQAIGAIPDPQPRVWVVEPRIPIAVDQMKFMNSLWHEYLQQKGERQLPPLFGCISSASGNMNRDAPIKFVTTGIFELMTRGGELTPARDRVIIDEAHVTIEQNPGVELGIALARQAGVTIDYMSATVDTTTLQQDLGVQSIIRADKQRYVIWKHNLMRPLDEALPSIIEATLTQPNEHSNYFPRPDEFRQANEVLDAVLETGRSHGLLAVVNSFAGDKSDIRRLADVIRKHFPDLPVLQLASEVVRDARREREFQQRLLNIEAAKQNYVILATSVVEMGITFPTLDFMVSMDSGYDQETIGDVSFPVVAPLGVNALLQRIGRVGRKRPGIAYISYEVGAEYAEFEDREINGNKLRYEPIRFPMASAPLMPLAYYACSQQWDDLDQWVASLNLPSRLHENPDRMAYLREQIDMLEGLGLVSDSRLTQFGERMEQWIGQADLAYTIQLQRRFEAGCTLPELLFWVATTALSNTPLVTLRAQHDYFVDFSGIRTAIAHDIDVWSGFWHEDLAAFSVVARLAAMSPYAMFSGKRLGGWEGMQFDRWCSMAGIDGRKMLNAGRAISDLWQLFCRINGHVAQFRQLFGNQQRPDLTAMPWATCAAQIPAQQIHYDLVALSGVARLTITANEIGGFDWRDDVHGHSGMLNQDDTPVHVLPDYPYVARLVPSREAKGAGTTWRAAHFGMHLEPTPPPEPLAEPAIEAARAAKVPAETDVAEPQRESFLSRARRVLGI
jgi:Helicase conserved C-terminal domain/DEAD/DEAH box helicase